jgi:hypothetical protein
MDFSPGAGQNNGIPPVSAESMKTRPLAIPLILKRQILLAGAAVCVQPSFHPHSFTCKGA